MPGRSSATARAPAVSCMPGAAHTDAEDQPCCGGHVQVTHERLASAQRAAGKVSAAERLHGPFGGTLRGQRSLQHARSTRIPGRSVPCGHRARKCGAGTKAPRPD